MRLAMRIALGSAIIAMASLNLAGSMAGDSVSSGKASASPVGQGQPSGELAQSVPIVTKDFLLFGKRQQGGLLRGQAPTGAVSVTFDGEPVTMAADGAFIVGIDRDHESQASLVATLANGSQVEQALTIEPTQWRLEHINAPYRAGVSSAAFKKRRSGELAQIVAARAEDTGADGWRQDFIWPVKGRISGRFGSQRVYQGKPGSYHGGLDIAVPTGTTYVAPADGTVILAADSPFTLEGKLLMIDHGHGLNSAFLHSSALLVKVGDKVVQGQPIGKVGATGRATGPHLHWALKWEDARIDPLLLTPAM